MSLFQELRQFAVKGNAIDMAVGIIIGGAFGKIVSSLVNDVIMPPMGRLLGAVNFNDLFLSLSGQAYPSLAAAREAGAPVLAYGAFVQTVVDFLIVAAVVFLMVKALHRAKRKEAEAPAAPAAPSEEVVLLRQIRDGLAGGSR